MSLDSVVDVSITTLTTGVTQAAFNVPLLCGYHTAFPERVREYDISSGLAGLVTDGFATTSPIYKMAAAFAAQDPKIKTIKVGRRANAPTQIVHLTPLAQNATIYHVYINGVNFQFLSGAGATVAEIVTGLDAALDQVAWAHTTAYTAGLYRKNGGNVYRCTTGGTSAGAGGPSGTGSGIVDGTVVWTYEGAEQPVAPTDATTHLIITSSVAGTMFEIELDEDYEGLNLWAREDKTADPGLAADLTAISLEDDDWYLLCLDSQGAAEITVAATWIELVRKIFGATSGDSAILTSSVADIASVLYGASRARTFIVYDQHPHERAAEAWAGVVLPFDPGSATWKFKRASGITPLTLTATQKGYLDAKKCNYCVRIGGIPIFTEGVMAVGEFIDIIQGVDWFRARLQERIFAILANLKKLPFTNNGVAAIEAEVWAQIAAGVRTQFLSEAGATVTVMDAAAVPSADKLARHLPGTEFSAILAGAIHSLTITGVIAP